MANLWSTNHPRNFWQCQPDFPDVIWQEALKYALPVLGISGSGPDADTILELTLGEAQFGPKRYQLGPSRQLYYLLKPFLPRNLTRMMRSAYNSTKEDRFRLAWPIEPRFVQFQWEVLKQAMLLSRQSEINFRYFWPQGKEFAFVLTHDVETEEGQRLIPVLSDMEEALGFHSLFNFVPERYPLDLGLIEDLRQRGFEIGIHGLKHDGKLFNSYDHFIQRAKKINEYLVEFGAVGFRSPLTLRNPAWMQMLDIDYDLSFFDTDPYEPMPGGAMSIWPFTIGRFLELPYTLPQDYTLFNIMGETSSRLWLEKIDFLEKNHGMALVIVHPDYSSRGRSNQIYGSFLQKIRERGKYWHALPSEVARWWKNRSSQSDGSVENHQQIAKVSLDGDAINIIICT